MKQSKLTTGPMAIVFIIIQMFCSIQNVMSQKINPEKHEIKIIKEAILVKPSPRQYEWQKNEFTAFIHFGVNTFTGREWGTGFEDPKIFNPNGLNTDQWCETIKSAGMKMVIITAKHHDGFCLWPTRYTSHSVASSSWANGHGDVLKDLSESCKKYNLKLGIYLSPADLFQIETKNGLYGNGSKYSERIIPRIINERPFEDKRSFKFVVDDYNEYFMNQLFELLTEYGPIDEVWFDGAHPKRKGGQTYTYSQWYELIRELAPDAVIFGRGPDVRWCGNEAGNTRQSEWSVIPIDGTEDDWQWPDMTEADLGSLAKISKVIDKGGFLHWYPAETNTSIRKGWFWRDEAQYVKSVDEILDIWYRSVGGNTVFLLNVPPNTNGLLSFKDVNTLKQVGKILNKTFNQNLAQKAKVIASSSKNYNYKAENILDGNLNTCWMPNDWEKDVQIEITLPKKTKFNRILLQEQIQDFSQRVSKFEIYGFIDGKWKKISSGSTIGYKKICRIGNIFTDKVKIKFLSSRVAPTINNFGLYYEEVRIPSPKISRDKEGNVSISCSPPGPQIRFTRNGENPDEHSTLFTKPFILAKPGTIKAIAINLEGNKKSEIVSKSYDICHSKWSIHSVSSEQADNNEDANKAIDENDETNWITRWRPDSPLPPHFIAINLGEEIILKGFSYTPRKYNVNGTIKNFNFYISSDGIIWKKILSQAFGNIKNNPVQQKVYFQNKVNASYIKLESLSEINEKPWASAAEIGVITE